MVKNCLFEERIIAKEQRGRVCCFLQEEGSDINCIWTPCEAAGRAWMGSSGGEGEDAALHGLLEADLGAWTVSGTERGGSHPTTRTCSLSHGAFRNVFVFFKFFLTLSVMTWSIYTKKHPKQTCADQRGWETICFKKGTCQCLHSPLPSSPHPQWQPLSWLRTL